MKGAKLPKLDLVPFSPSSFSLSLSVFFTPETIEKFHVVATDPHWLDSSEATEHFYFTTCATKDNINIAY